MRQAHRGRKAGIPGRAFLVTVVLAAVLLPRVGAGGPIIYFSTEESFTATAGPYAGQTISDGDLLSSTGRIVATNRQLLRNFGPMPPTPPSGLDGVYVCPSGEIRFSIETGFWDERLGVAVKHGDLLSNKGVVLKKNTDLLRNFHPMPIVAPDYGLDAVDGWLNSGTWFSIETNFFDERLGKTVGHGDLLSETGVIVKTNSQLLTGFHPMPSPTDYGLDAVHVLPNGRIMFSIEETFWDESRGDWIGHGDLLAAGLGETVVKTNEELLAAFFGGASKVPRDFGLDAVWISSRPGDLNGDGMVNAADASILAANWGGEAVGEGAAVPEPAAWMLAIAGTMLWTIAGRARGRTSV